MSAHQVKVASLRLDEHHAWCGGLCTIYDILHNDLLDAMLEAGSDTSMVVEVSNRGLRSSDFALRWLSNCRRDAAQCLRAQGLGEVRAPLPQRNGSESAGSCARRHCAAPRGPG